MLDGQLHVEVCAEVEPERADEPDRTRWELGRDSVLLRLRNFIVHKQDALGLAVLFQLAGKVVSEHQVKLLADLAFKRASEVHITSDYPLEREHLVAGEDFIFELADEEFRVQVCETLLSCIHGEKLTVHFAQVLQVDWQGHIKLTVQVDLSDRFL